MTPETESLLRRIAQQIPDEWLKTAKAGDEVRDIRITADDARALKKHIEPQPVDYYGMRVT